jgi:hypothetical protein
MKIYRKENADKIKKIYNEQKVCCSVCRTLTSEKDLTRHQKSKKYRKES